MAARSSLTRRPRPSQRAQHNLAKVGVEGSNPFARSILLDYYKSLKYMDIFHLFLPV